MKGRKEVVGCEGMREVRGRLERRREVGGKEGG